VNKTDNPELSRIILNHLAELYKIKEKREGIHLSTLIYCLTRSFFDTKAMVEPTDEEVMLFALGYGLQDVLTPTATYTPVYEKEGITFSPDFVFRPKDYSIDKMVEIKTTRMSSSKEDFPETWLVYIKGGCYMRDVSQYELSVLHMLGSYKPPFPEIKSYLLEFTPQELLDNWNYLLGRKIVYADSLESNKPPTPRKHCYDWECKNCRYKMQCDALLMIKQEN
jgi:hypothetical protein